MSSIVTRALVKKLQKANEAYRVGSPTMSDEAYDKDIALLRKLDPSNAFLKSVEPTPVLTDRGEVVHPYPMLSIDKAYTSEELASFVGKVLALRFELREDWNEDTFLFRITPKLDGIAARYYPNGLLATRGDGKQGSDISSLLDKGLSLVEEGRQPVPLKDMVEDDYIDGELVIPKRYFDDNLAQDFSYPRNVVAGLASAKYLNATHEALFKDKAIHFAAYDGLPNFIVSGKMICENIDYYFDSLTRNCDYVCDGIVIEVVPDLKQVRSVLGSTDSFHRYMVAHKRKGDMAVAVVRDVTWQVGRTGTLTPVIEIEATALTGSIIRRVTGHNVDYMEKHGIGAGAHIRITRAGDVIPKHEETVQVGAPLVVPTHCPSCSSELVRVGVTVACIQDDCDEKIVQSMVYFFQSLGNADLLGDKTIRKIRATFPHITRVDEVLSLAIEELVSCGLGPTQAINVHNELCRACVTEVADYVLLASFGFPLLGTGNAKKLLRVLGWDRLMTASVEDIRAIKGFEVTTATAIATALQENCERLRSVKERMVNVRMTQPAEKSVLSGLSVCFTGSFEGMKRNDIEAQAESLGATVQSAVNKKTNYLIYGSKLGDGKKTSAEKNGTKVISYNEYLDLISTS